MSHAALHLVTVRMLYDHAFARAVFADAHAATAGLELTPREIDWLTAVDPRAYRTDAERRARSLSALLEEYPVSCALTLRDGERPVDALPRLDAFFSSPTFHDAIQGERSLGLAFGVFLAELETGDRRTANAWRLLEEALPASPLLSIWRRLGMTSPFTMPTLGLGGCWPLAFRSIGCPTRPWQKSSHSLST